MYNTKHRYYHLTREEELADIKLNGLIPSIGKNSSRVGEVDNLLYFSDEESIPYWSILLGKTRVLVVEIDSMLVDMKKHVYYGYAGNYVEFITESKIPASNVLDSYVAEYYTPTYMNNLCINYTQIISSTVLGIINSLSYKDDRVKEINDTIFCLLETLRELDFTYCSDEALANTLRQMNEECGYPFTDTYLRTPFRLWEALLLFNDESTFIARKALYEFIKSTYGEIAYTKTGGFTG